MNEGMNLFILNKKIYTKCKKEKQNTSKKEKEQVEDPAPFLLINKLNSFLNQITTKYK